MPWDEYGYPIEDFMQGIRCGFCGSRGPCSHDYDYPSDERPMPDERPESVTKEGSGE